MKRATLTLGAVATAISVFAQGTVNFNNTSGTLITTNLGSPSTTGPTAPFPAAIYYYGLFIAPVGQTIGGQANLLGGPWTFTGVYATNTSAASGGRLSGGPMAGVGGEWRF